MLRGPCNDLDRAAHGFEPRDAVAVARGHGRDRRLGARNERFNERLLGTAIESQIDQHDQRCWWRALDGERGGLKQRGAIDARRVLERFVHTLEQIREVRSSS